MHPDLVNCPATQLWKTTISNALFWKEVHFLPARFEKPLSQACLYYRNFKQCRWIGKSDSSKHLRYAQSLLAHSAKQRKVSNIGPSWWLLIVWTDRHAVISLKQQEKLFDGGVITTVNLYLSYRCHRAKTGPHLEWHEKMKTNNYITITNVKY